jgi:hypothetical protein
MANEAIKYLDGKTFREDGYLQEANRIFFHPLGLALELDLEAGTLRVWDYRDDPEGIVFSPGDDLAEKAGRVMEIRKARMPARMKALGYWRQPAAKVNELLTTGNSLLPEGGLPTAEDLDAIAAEKKLEAVMQKTFCDRCGSEIKTEDGELSKFSLTLALVTEQHDGDIDETDQVKQELCFDCAGIVKLALKHTGINEVL